MTALAALTSAMLLVSCPWRGDRAGPAEPQSRVGQDFWETGITSGVRGAPSFETLRSMAAATQVLVLGRAISVRDASEAALRIPDPLEVEVEVLQEFRSIEEGAEGYPLVVGKGDAPDLGSLQRRLPSGRGLYFLRRSSPGAYTLLSPEALLIDVDGRVVAPLSEEGDGLLQTVQGRPFDEVVTTIRRMTGG